MTSLHVYGEVGVTKGGGLDETFCFTNCPFETYEIACVYTYQFPGSQLFGSNTFGFFDIASDTPFKHWSESQCSIPMFVSLRLLASTMVLACDFG